MIGSIPTIVRLSRQLARLDLPSIARRSGWLARAGGKITAESFCLGLIASTQVAAASLRIVAFASGAFAAASVSRQALHKRVNAKALEFLGGVLNAAILWRLGDGKATGKAGFRRIVVQDSTSLGLPMSMYGLFPASGNQTGEAAGMKVHTTFDLLSRRLLGFAVTDARTPDQRHAASGAEGLGKGDLLIRDLGYFSVPALREVMASGVDVITRLRLDVALYDPETRSAVDLPRLLRSAETVDVQVLAGRDQLLPMRLVAFRLPAEIGQERRRALRRNAKRRSGGRPSKLALSLQDWQIYLTSCGDLGCDQLRELYRQRWGVEILFKAFKSHGRLEGAPPLASAAMIQCLILSNLIRITLAHTFLLPALLARSKGKPVSELKLHSLCETLACIGPDVELDQSSVMENILRHCLYETRKRKPLPQRLATLG